MPVQLPRAGYFPIVGQKNVITVLGNGLVIPAKEGRNELIGQPAPEIDLPDHMGRRCSLHATMQLGRPIIVFFFPLAGSPHCTQESCLFRDALGLTPVFADMNAIVIGISQDPPDRSKKFVDEHKLQYRILHDSERRTMDQWGVGRTMLGMVDCRCTFIIDPNGIIRGMVEGVLDAAGHLRYAERWLVRLEHEYSARSKKQVELEAQDSDLIASTEDEKKIKVTYGPEGSASLGGIGGAPRYGAGSMTAKHPPQHGSSTQRSSSLHRLAGRGSKESKGSRNSRDSATGDERVSRKAQWKGVLANLSSADDKPPPAAASSSDDASVRSSTRSTKRRTKGAFSFLRARPPPIPPTYANVDENVEEFGEVDPEAAEHDEVPEMPSLDGSTWSSATTNGSASTSSHGPHTAAAIVPHAPRKPDMTTEVVMTNAPGWTAGREALTFRTVEDGGGWTSIGQEGGWGKATQVAEIEQAEPVIIGNQYKPLPSAPLRGVGLTSPTSARNSPTPTRMGRQRSTSSGAQTPSAPLPPLLRPTSPPLESRRSTGPSDVPCDVESEENLAQTEPTSITLTEPTADTEPVRELTNALSSSSLSPAVAAAAASSAKRNGKGSSRPAHILSPASAETSPSEADLRSAPSTVPTASIPTASKAAALQGMPSAAAGGPLMTTLLKEVGSNGFRRPSASSAASMRAIATNSAPQANGTARVSRSPESPNSATLRASPSGSSAGSVAGANFAGGWTTADPLAKSRDGSPPRPGSSQSTLRDRKVPPLKAPPPQYAPPPPPPPGSGRTTPNGTPSMSHSPSSSFAGMLHNNDSRGSDPGRASPMYDRRPSLASIRSTGTFG